MTSSDFFTDPFALVSYPWEFLVLKDWLIQYYGHLGRSPDVLRSLREEKGEFELVPIPRRLHEQLLRADFLSFGRALGVSDFVASPLLSAVTLAGRPLSPVDAVKERVRCTEKLRTYPQLVALVRKLSEALETGNVQETMKYVSEDYVDLQGRGKSELEKALTQLVKTSSDRRIVFVHAESFEPVDDKIVASVTGAWEARLGQKRDLASEFFVLELVFVKDSEGAWKVGSVKYG